MQWHKGDLLKLQLVSMVCFVAQFSCRALGLSSYYIHLRHEARKRYKPVSGDHKLVYF